MKNKSIILAFLAFMIFVPQSVLYAANVSVGISADRTVIERGGTVTLSWNSANASYCRAPFTGSVASSGVQAVNPSETTTYTITCGGDSGSNSASVTITVTNATSSGTGTGTGSGTSGGPIVTISANPTSISRGLGVNLSWNSSNAYSCSASWTASIAPFGNQVVYPSNTGSYSITCFGLGGSNSASVGIFVSDSSGQPTTGTPTTTSIIPLGVGLVSNVNNITLGSAVSLYWASVNADYCSAPWTADRSSGGRQVVYPTQTTTYSIQCFKDGRAVTAQHTVMVSVSGTSPRPSTSYGGGTTIKPAVSASGTVILVAAPATIQKGSFSVLRWNSTNTTKCDALSPDNWTISSAVSGEQVVYPKETTTYVIRCAGKNFSDFANATVIVEDQIARDLDEDKDDRRGLGLLGTFGITKLFFGVVVFALILAIALAVLKRYMPGV